MRLLDGRSYAYQWDSNIYVILPKAKIGEEIHFAHRKDKKALVMTAIEIDSVIVAEVPICCFHRPSRRCIVWFWHGTFCGAGVGQQNGASILPRPIHCFGKCHTSCYCHENINE